MKSSPEHTKIPNEDLSLQEREKIEEQAYSKLDELFVLLGLMGIYGVAATKLLKEVFQECYENPAQSLKKIFFAKLNNYLPPPKKPTVN